MREQLGEIYHILRDIIPNNSEEDKVIWRWDKSENFLVKLTYRCFIDGGVNSAEAKFIWSACSYGYWGSTPFCHSRPYKSRDGQA